MLQNPSRPAAGIVNSRASAPRGAVEHARSSGIDQPLDHPEVQRPTRGFWADRIRVALAKRSPQAFQVAEDALQSWPADAEILLLAALTALAGNQPDRALRLLKRYGKRHAPGKLMTLLMGLTLAQQGHFTQAWATLAAEELTTDRAAHSWFIGNTVMEEWLYDRLREIRRERLRVTGPSRARPSPVREAKPEAARPKASPPVAPTPPAVPDLPRLEAAFGMTFDLANPDAIEITGRSPVQEIGRASCRERVSKQV